MKIRILVAAAALASSGVASAQTLNNGSFEALTVGGNGVSTFNATSSGVAGWTVDRGSIDVVSNAYWQNIGSPLRAYNGANVVDLNGNAGGRIWQSFATVVGAAYSMTFRYAVNTNTTVNAEGQARIGSSLNGVGSDFIIDLAPTVSNTWYSGRIDFIGTGQPMFASFRGLNDGASGVVIDSVSVVPEPGTYALMLAGLGVVGWLARRRGVIGGRHAEPMPA